MNYRELSREDCLAEISRLQRFLRYSLDEAEKARDNGMLSVSELEALKRIESYLWLLGEDN